MKYGVLIYEDNPQLRSGIEQLIMRSDELLLLGSFANAVSAVDQVKELQPDVVLMDIELPGGVSGIDAVKMLRKHDSAVKIIMLTVFDDSRIVLDAIVSGASGYLLKKNISENLAGAVREVLNGGAPMSPTVARMVIASMQQKNASGEEDKYRLTSRERQILTALSEGTSYKIIAAQNFISIDTVRSHIKHIYQKMQVHNQLEAVSRARNEGLIP